MMQSITGRFCRLAAVVAVAGWGTVVAPAMAQAPAGPRATLPAEGVARPGAQATQPAGAAGGRKFEQVVADIEAMGKELRTVQPTMDALFDPAQRAAAAAKALPVMRRMLPLLDEMAKVQPETAIQMGGAKLELTAMMAMLGDADARASLKKMADSNLRDQRVGAQAWLLAVDWSNAAKQAPVQERLLAQLTELARVNPENDMVAQVASLMCDRAATPALAEQAENLVIQTLRGPVALSLSKDLMNRRKLQALEGKPLVIEGVMVDGKAFSSAGWKGKVVLVDFWATWCPPCMAQLPKVKKLYADLHANGLEIVGVSSDRDPENFRAFLQDNKDMPWPQLIDPTSKDWHPLTAKFGVDSIPTMFVIDRKGVCRSVKAAENFEELVKKLLDEKAN